ncbi:hypothetical protein BVC80_1035g1 [Macleaya cordata]|uniref:Uncharacterized protein n=1 Tax=Macleaya cordata TaxID=56857 RepID=A0A200QVM0_MACCD|nr:hypothetical protein BVC80_1035g1 [Macleaya cordata]
MGRAKAPVSRDPPPSNPVERLPMTRSNRKRRMLSRAGGQPTEVNDASSSAPPSNLDIGAPTDPSLLQSFEFQVAARIWSGDVLILDSGWSTSLDVHNRYMTLKKWPLEGERQFAKDVVERAHLTILAEPYYPNRILRQLGRVQSIPIPPMRTMQPRIRTSRITYPRAKPYT